MPFTAQELANIGNAALDFYIKGPALSQTIQERPLMDVLMKRQKTFPGGKDFISMPVKGKYTTKMQGFSHDDTVGYGNPANIKRVIYPWKETHAGIEVTLSELKKDGISVVDSHRSESTTEHTDREKTALTNILDDKLEDMAEGWARDFNEMLWRDGTQDAKLVPGIRSFILDTPEVGTTGGLDRVANDWWRNRASLAIDVSTPANLNLVNTLQKEYRQLRRRRGNPNMFFAGADFIEALEKELRSKGNYTDNGWAVSKDGKNARFEASMSDIAFKGVPVQYDPTLDDLLLAKYGYWLDSKRITLMPMDGEDRKTHTPGRPHDKYAMYRAMTWTGGLPVQQLNSSGVYSIA